MFAKKVVGLFVVFMIVALLASPVLALIGTTQFDKSEYNAGGTGKASITVQNDATRMIRINDIMIRFDWMDSRFYYKNVETVYLDVGDKKNIGTVSFSVDEDVDEGRHSYEVGIEYEENYPILGWIEKTAWSSGGYISITHVGSLSISSTPSRVSVYVDGSYKGVTPITISNIEVGTHSIKLTKSGYYDETTTASVLLNKVAYVSETLEEKTGSIAISSSPSGASVYLDGSYKGVAPLTISDVSIGSHTVKVTKSGYEDYSESVYVSAGSTEYVSASLTRKPTPTPTPRVNAAAMATATPAASPTATQPGFEAIFTIAGILSVAYLMMRRKI